MDQAAEAKRSGPHTNYKQELIKFIHNAYIFAETKLEIMQCTVVKCPRMSIIAHGIPIPSLLDSDSEVTLLRQSYFEQHLLLKIKLVTGKKANAHILFSLTVANDGQLLIKMYAKFDITFLAL